MSVPRLLGPAALALLAGLLAAAYSAQGDHVTTFENEPMGLVENEEFHDVVILNVPNGTLVNASIEDLEIKGSSWVAVEDVTIEGTHQISDSDNIAQSGVSVHGTFTIESSEGLGFFEDEYFGDVRIFASGVAFENVTFHGGLCADTSEVTWSNTTPEFDDIPGCSTTGGEPTPTDDEPPMAADPPFQNYHYELADQEIHEDVWISAAGEVTIRDVTIEGSLTIVGSTYVVLERVHVARVLILESSKHAEFNDVTVGGDVGFARVFDFSVEDAHFLGHLGCFQCKDGSYKDVDVEGQFCILESENVDASGIDAAQDCRFEALPPTVTPVTPLPGPSVSLSVTGSDLSFVHERETTSARLATDIRLEVSALQAQAQLKVKHADTDEVAFQLGSHFDKIIEFVDRDGNDKYDLDDDRVREYGIDDLAIKAITHGRVPDGGQRGQIDYSLGNGGTFSLIFIASDRDPDLTLVDIAFSNYAYAHRDSRLALQTRLDFASDWSVVYGETEDKLLFEGDDYVGYFSWVHTATVDGHERPVVAQVLEEHRRDDQRELVLFLSYARGQNIYHDPSIGVFEALGIPDALVPEIGDLPVYGTTLVAVVVVLWALGQGTRRRPA